MRWIRESWPSFDNNWTLPFGTLTDLIGIGLAVLGVFVAWRVYVFTKRIALRQLEIMERQTMMMKE